MQKGLFPRAGHESAMSQSLWLFVMLRRAQALPHQIASAGVTSVPVPQPVASVAGTLLPANPLAGMILDFKHMKKSKGKINPQNGGA